MNEQISVDYVLYRLNETFQVKHISNALETAKDTTVARSIKSQKNFDRIPIKVNGKITTYYASKLDSEKKIDPQEIISESSGILETLSYLSRGDFYFILSGNDINHIVHYSDLNNPLVSLGIYAQITYCEIAIRNFVRSKNPSNLDYGEKFLNDINRHYGVKLNVERAKSQFQDKKISQTETDLFDELYFDEELVLFRELIKSGLEASRIKEFEQIINLEDSKIKCLKDKRNGVMHSKPEIIKKQSDIMGMLNFLQICQNITTSFERTSLE